MSDRHPMSAQPGRITILGGGIAGLAVSFYAKKAGIPFTIYEASPHLGGNCRTFVNGGFRYDSGAHRFHDKDHDVTHDLLGLLGGQLGVVRTPSQVYSDGKFLDFPLSPRGVVKHLGIATACKAGCEIATKCLTARAPAEDFRQFATRTYGTAIAERFLLNYSEKLWGLPPAQLSTQISGNRLKGLTPKTLFAEMFSPRNHRTRHLDGSFYYPQGGIGLIAEKLAGYCGRETMFCDSPVKRICHRRGRITTIEVAGRKSIDVDQVVSTLPLGRLLEYLDPPAPAEILSQGRLLDFRRLVLVAVFLDCPAITPNASIYFPEPAFPFTRVYEPRNRWDNMAPPGHTSLVVEIPCPDRGGAWEQADSVLTDQVCSFLNRLGWLTDDQVVGAAVHRIPYAYPILRRGVEGTVQQVLNYLQGLANLRITGRSGLFQYSHIHNLMRSGKDLIQAYSAESR